MGKIHLSSKDATCGFAPIMLLVFLPSLAGKG